MFAFYYFTVKIICTDGYTRVGFLTDRLYIVMTNNLHTFRLTENNLVVTLFMLQCRILVKRLMHAFQRGQLVYNKQEYMDLHMYL